MANLFSSLYSFPPQSYLDLFVSLRADPRKGFVVSPDRIEGERRGRVYQRRGGVNLRIGDFNKIKVCRDNCLMFLFFSLSLSLCKDNIFHSSFAKSMRFLISRLINFYVYINMGHEIGSINTSLNTLFNTCANCNAKDWLIRSLSFISITCSFIRFDQLLHL